jgi:hypothetical protein
LRRVLLILSSIIIINGAFLYSSAYAGPAPPDSETLKLRRSIKTILKDPHFNYRDNLSWLKWVLKKAGQLFKSRPRKDAALNLQGKGWWLVLKILGIVGLVLIPLLFVYLANHFLQPDWRLKKQKEGGVNPETNSTELERTAFSMAKAGQFRDAVRFLYLAGLEKLKEENLLPQAVKFSDKENLRSLRRRLGESNSGYVAFADLTGIFQEKWYGLRDCQALDYQLAQTKLKIIHAIKS